MYATPTNDLTTGIINDVIRHTVSNSNKSILFLGNLKAQNISLIITMGITC